MDDFSTETWQTGGRQYEASGLHSGTQKNSKQVCIPSAACIFFTPLFTAVYIVERLLLQTK